MKMAVKILIIFVICLVILFTLLLLVNCIPRKYIENNVAKSCNTLTKEGYYPSVKYSFNNFLLDNYTDAIMIDTAYSIDNNNPFEATILMRRNWRPNTNLELTDYDVEDRPIEYLIENVNETNNTYSEYTRYWHGYMLYLRPLLILFNYSQIRIVLTVVIAILSIILIYFIYKKINKNMTIATIAMLIMYSFWSIGLSLQYSSVFLITIISSIYLIWRYDKIKEKKYVFL